MLPPKSIVCLLLLLLLVTQSVATGQGESIETQQSVKMIRGLQERRLFELAEEYARIQLDSELDPNIEKVTVLIELLRSNVVQAASLTGTAREKTWARTHLLATDFLASNPDHPRKLLLQIQDALTHYSHGNLIGQEIAAEIQSPSQNPTVLEQFRSANKLLESVDKEIENLLPIARSQSPKNGELTEQELVNLKNNVRFQLARINLARAEMYDASQQLSQVDALQQVLKRLDGLIGQTNSDVPLWWRAQTSRIRCLRLMKRFDQANRVVDDLPETELTDDLRSALLTERILIAAETGDGSSRDEIFNELATFTRPGPQLSLAVLTWMMASASQASGATKKELQQQAADWVAAIESGHGPYWGRRAEILLVGSIQPDVSNPNLAEGDFQILVRQADTAFRKGNYPDAARAYAKAAQFAQRSGSAKDAIYLSVRQAQCYENSKDHKTAATTLIVIANQFSEQPNAAAVHLRGCWNYARTLSNNPERKAEFAKLLTNQSSTWPNAEPSNQARIWLGDHYQNEKQWEAAIQAYLSVSRESSKSLTAAEQTAGATKRWFAAATTQRKDVASRIAKLIDDKLRFGSIDNWSESDRLLLLEWIDAGLISGSANLQQATTLLQSAMATVVNDQPDWQRRASLRRIVLSMKQDVAVSELEQQVRELPLESKLLKELTQLADGCFSQQQQSKYATLTMLVCGKALSDAKSVNDLTYWQIKKAASALALGQAENVLADLESLASQNPKSLEIQLTYCRVLSEIPGHSAAAMNQWRKLATKVRKGTDAWYESKYNVARLMVDDGKADEAEKLIEYLQATLPDWSNSDWSERFEQLMNDQCR